MAGRNNDRKQGGRVNRHHVPFKHPHQYYESSRSSDAAVESKEIEQLIFDLADKNKRDIALFKLCSTDKLSPKLGPLLWHSIHTIAIFLEEIVSVYRFLSPPALTPDQSTRVCRILRLLRCVASHQETKALLVQAKITAYLQPFLETDRGSELLADLRYLSLVVIAHLLFGCDLEMTSSVVDLGILPLVLRCMDFGMEASKISATVILYIILSSAGHKYVFPLPDKLNEVNDMLNKMAVALPKKPSEFLYQVVIKCYIQLSQDENGLLLLRESFPLGLVADDIFRPYWEVDETTAGLCRSLYDRIRGRGH